MKVIIPSKGRADRLTTPALFAEQDYHVLVHNEEEWDRYHDAHPEIPCERLHNTRTQAEPFGKTRQQEWACRELVAHDEWFIFADDNLQGITALPEPWCRERYLNSRGSGWQRIYDTPCSQERFWQEITPELQAETERVRGHLGGFSVHSNALYRQRKWGHIGYVIGSLILWHNLPFTWDHRISMEDMRNSAEHIVQYGAVAINRYAYAVKRHHQPGGLGTSAERRGHRQEAVRLLLQQYPGFFKRRRDPLDPDGVDLVVTLRETQAEPWRSGLLAGTAR